MIQVNMCQHKVTKYLISFRKAEKDVQCVQLSVIKNWITLVCDESEILQPDSFEKLCINKRS